MNEMETTNPKPESEVDVSEEAVADSSDQTEVAEIETIEVETSSDTEAAEAAPPEEDESPEDEVEVDYLAPSLLDDITTLTPEQLEAMEESEVVKRDASLEDIVRSSVGDIREDEVLRGRVIGTNEREVLVDIGFKSEGIVPKEEFNPEELPQIGDEISVYLVRMEDSNGQTVLSKEKADFMERWAEVRHKSQSGENIVGRIVRRIKGGMVVDLSGVPAFLPGSQIDIRPVQNFDDFIGQEFEFKIVKLNEARKNIVLSRKELLEADLQERKSSLIADLHVGQVLEGRVKNITDFGVFIDLGGLDGLLHITDLSWGRVSHPSEIVELDEPITIKVIDFDQEKQRVSLGLKQLQPHPWDAVEVKYPVGSVVEGKVVSMTNYGAFVEIEKGVEGLIHVSEMSWTKHVRHPSEMFTLGQSIEAKILNVDIEDRKISLGIKQLQPDPWDQIEEKYKVGTLQKGKVRNLTQFGAFVELEEGIDGLIHITDLSWTKNVRHPKEVLNKGDEVEVRVLDVSRENRRIALGLKQVAEDPWEQIEAYFTTGKQVEGEIIRVLDKGVILQMEMDMEGIIPLRDIPKRDRRKATEHLNPGEKLQVTVQELSVDDKKVVLMADVLSIEPVDHEAPPTPKEVEADQEVPSSEEAAATVEVTEEAAEEAATVEEPPVEEAEEAKAPKRKKKAAKTEAAEEAVEKAAAVEEPPVEEAEEAKAPKRKKKAAKAEATEEAAEEVVVAEEPPAEEAEEAKAPKRKKKAAKAEAAEEQEKASDTSGKKAEKSSATSKKAAESTKKTTAKKSTTKKS
ncbi:MAG: 30S ribosomal protein S1 [Fidelibacterota bacterium]|nr:MAG: 30S ribosomal protein S1 [Candidatus Neomarinimicrobiota bacterium]